MFAWVTTVRGKPELIEAGILNFRKNVGPAAKKLVGFNWSHLFAVRKSGKMLEIALWDMEDNLKASANTARQLTAGVTQAAATTKPPTVKIYEVAVQL